MADPRSTADGGARFPVLRALSDVAWRLVAVAVAVYVLGLVLARLWLVALPVALALLLTSLLRPAVWVLVDRGVPRLAATWLVLLGGLAVVGTAVGLSARALYLDADELIDAVSRGWERVQEMLENSPLEVSAQELRDMLSESGGDGGNIAGRLFAGAFTALQGLTVVVLTGFFTFFFVKDGDRLFSSATSWLDDRRRTLVRGAGLRVWGDLSAYIRHQALIAVINALQVALVLLILGIPLALPIAVLTFVGSFIPFVGPVVAGAAGGLVALADQGLGTAVTFVVIQFVYQQLENNILEPMLLGHGMRLHPTVIAASVTGGALVAGLAGAFLAVPVVAGVFSIVAHLRENASDS